MREGRAPARITAMQMSNTGVNRTRPLCPYPQVAKYVGSGSIDHAENFRCVADVGMPTPPPTPGRRAATR
jgi:feruloyl esterase